MKERITFPSIGKALFIDFNKFTDWYKSDGGFNWSYIEIDGRTNNHRIYIYPKQSIIGNMISDDLYKRDIDSNFKKDSPLAFREYLLLDKLQTYITRFGSNWDILYTDDIFTIIRFGENSFLILNQFLNLQLFETHENLTLGELNSKLYLNSNTDDSNSLIANDLSLSSVKSQKKVQTDAIDNLQDDIKAIEKELDDKIQALRNEARIQKQKIERMKTSLQVKVEELHTQIFMLETLVYAVECRLGEIVDFMQLREGDEASIDTPLVIFQKLRYLDEDLPIFASIYNFEFNDSYIFEELLQNREDIVEYFCPSDKCISFIRISKTGTNFSKDYENNILKEYDILHGKTVGILVRNGGNLYFAWTDEHRILLPDGNVFYTPGTSEVNLEDIPKSKYILDSLSAEQEAELSEEEYKEYQDKDKITYYKDKYGWEGRKVASKVFVFSIIQGLLDDKKLVEIPEELSLLSKPKSSQYLIFSYADGTLEDNRYGNFSDILERLQDNHKWGDTILSTISLHDYSTSNSWSYSRFQRSVDGSSRTHDCDVKDCTIYRINLIKPQDRHSYTEYYVSLEKRWSDYGARSNFMIQKDEFINLTFLNSEWLYYAIINKKVGNFSINGKVVSYAHAVRYLKYAYQYLKEREVYELSLIKNYLPNIEDDKTWMVDLSEWKLLKNVRNITDYQAKRFAKFLEGGRVL